MDIAAMSSMASQMKLAQAVSIKVAKLAMDSAKQSMDDQLRVMEQSVAPHKGGNIDIKL